MTRSIDLYELQQVDSAIDAADRRLGEIADALEQGSDLAELDEAVQSAETDLAGAERDQRALEEELADARSKTRTIEEKLYSGSVRLPRELKALQEDLESHQRQIATLEDRSLLALGQLEQARVSHGIGIEQREARVRAYDEAVAALQQERAELEAQLATLHTLRERRAARIDPPERTLYERLRRARGGRAVAKVERGTCQGCRITLPTTVFQRARSGLKIVQCTSCERILYVV